MNIIKNEKGVALVLAMIMLVLMSILGALALSTSSTELGISGNYRNSQDAFYAADRAMEYAATDGNIYASASLLAIGGQVNLNNAPYKDNISVDCATDNCNGRFGRLDTTATNTVTYIASGSLPTGFIYDADTASGYKANYFLITVTTTTADPADTTGSRSSIDAQIAKLVPKS